MGWQGQNMVQAMLRRGSGADESGVRDRKRDGRKGGGVDGWMDSWICGWLCE